MEGTWFRHEVGAASSRHIVQLEHRMGWPHLMAYARWFVLLEAVYKTQDGFLDFEAEKADLARELGIQETGLRMMLDFCADLGMIDAKCWRKKGLVTSEAVMRQVQARNHVKARTRRKVEKVCEHCGKAFRGDTNAKFCSRSCQMAAYRERKNGEQSG